jgi:hypothetical protein
MVIGEKDIPRLTGDVQILVVVLYLRKFKGLTVTGYEREQDRDTRIKK